MSSSMAALEAAADEMPVSGSLVSKSESSDSMYLIAGVLVLAAIVIVVIKLKKS